MHCATNNSNKNTKFGWWERTSFAAKTQRFLCGKFSPSRLEVLTNLRHAGLLQLRTTVNLDFNSRAFETGPGVKLDEKMSINFGLQPHNTGDIQRVLTNCKPASKASHASHHVSHARQMLVPSPFSFLRLLAAFGYLARVFAILALLSISFCYLPSS